MIPPFFSYFGSKYRLAKHYPPPEHNTIIEPFAGSAGYSTLYHDRNIILVERYYVLVRVWTYLIEASKKDILGLPLLTESDCIDDFDISLPEKYFVGFWLNKATTAPCKMLSKYALYNIRRGWCGSWNEKTRKRVAEHIHKISHWKIYYGGYNILKNQEATWFVDPPYQSTGYRYIHSMDDYWSLADWCKTRQGQVIVCEQEGADWLPFKPLCEQKGLKKRSKEVVWVK